VKGIVMEKYMVCRTIAILGETNNGFTKELNVVSWNNREPVYDIRTWDADHKKYGKGVTLTTNQILKLKEALDSLETHEPSFMQGKLD
jgi:hypothetical protein